MSRPQSQAQKNRSYELKKLKRKARREAAKRRDEFNRLIFWPPTSASSRYVEC